MFGRRGGEVTRELRQFQIEELHDLYSSPTMIQVITSKKIRWAGYVARMGGKRYPYRLLLGKPEGNAYKINNDIIKFNPLNAELNPICYLLAFLAHHFLHVSRIRVKSLTLKLLMSHIYIYIYIYIYDISSLRVNNIQVSFCSLHHTLQSHRRVRSFTSYFSFYIQRA
jgi:hypothetical protein